MDLAALCSQRNFVGPAAVEVADTGTKEGSAVTASAVKAGAEFGVIIDCFVGSEERGKWGTYSDTRVAWLYKGCLMVHKSCLAAVSGWRMRSAMTLKTGNIVRVEDFASGNIVRIADFVVDNIVRIESFVVDYIARIEDFVSGNIVGIESFVADYSLG